jgi:hypothetical protein
MMKSARKYTFRAKNNITQSAFFATKSVAASRLRRRKYALARRFVFPTEVLGGSLTQTHRRFGRATCHCAAGLGHPQWALTYSVKGTRYVQAVPADAVPELRRLVARGREYRNAVAELLAINAQLLSLWRKEQRGRPQRRGTAKRRD